MKSAYPQTQNPVSIRLYANIPFDNTYEHHSLISEWFKYNGSKIYDKAGVTACESFIDRKKYALTPNPPFYYPRWDMTDTYNFDFQNGLVGSVTLELTPEQTNANYMRVTCGSDVYYYFITGIKQVNFETYTLTLELDVIMTYQDEFLEGVKDIPLSTKRKHSHRFNSLGYPNCADFKNNEDAFAGIKPSITTSKTNLELKGNMKALDGASWLYIAVEIDSGYSQYDYQACGHPVCILVQPYNCSVILKDGSDTYTMDRTLGKLIGAGKVHGCKILPYPPFMDSHATITTTTNPNGSKTYTISSSNLEHSTNLWVYDDGVVRLVLREHQTGVDELNDDVFEIQTNDGLNYSYELLALDGIVVNEPTINDNRVKDPRLLFAPYKKYVLASPYGNDYEFYPELLYSMGGEDNTPWFEFETIATAYIGDNNITTYIKPQGDCFKYYKDLNIGLSCSVNYTLPAGTNALDVFNSTQAQSYYQSKIASGITSGLTIAGGVGSVIVGGVLTATGGGSPAGIGMIAGGVTAVAGGVASAVDNARSVNAKIEDLKNTPDSFNVNGSNYTSDFARTGGNMPYVITYECASIIQEGANDFFYNYGYAVARDCYFNTNLDYIVDSTEPDNNLFGRTIFNFVQLNEDITNKINANIPQVIKQKLSQVFNKGITLWSFFGCDALWNDNNLTALNDPDLWFMKHNLDNTEYQG